MKNGSDEREEWIRHLQDPEWVLQAITKAVHKALMDHKRAGNPVAAWRDGKVVIVTPEEIPDFEAGNADEVRVA